MQMVIYLDNNATTRVAPEVIEAMLPFFHERWMNPSSAYQSSHDVARDLENARAKVAALIGADAREIVFTSCGTESNNAALHSALVAQPQKRHIVSTAVEHSAVLRYAEFLANQGYAVTFLPVDHEGRLDVGALEQAIRPDTALVSVMWANNETGVLFPISEIAAICHKKGVLFHSDAVQAAGKLPIDVAAAGVDFLSLSAHKLYAPKGIGALYVRRGVKFQPYLMGGQQERGRRSGTENVPYIVGFGKAAELALANLPLEDTRVRSMRDHLEAAVLASVPGAARNGAQEPRLPNTSNLAFEPVEAEALLIKLDQAGICASSGSACASGSLEPSHVLKAMGLSAARARASIRFSLGIYNRAEDVEYLVDQLPGLVNKLCGLASLA